MLRVMFVDDDLLFLESVTQRFSREPGFSVVGAISSSDEALVLALREQPDIVVLDMELPGRGSFLAAAELASKLPESKVVFLCEYVSDVLIDEALRLGAAGYLLKSESVAAIAEHLKLIHAGEQRFSPVVQLRLQRDERRGAVMTRSGACLAALTHQQLEVLRHLARGDSVKQVAHAMQQSDRSIESQKYRIMQQLGIHDRVALTRFAIREGLSIP